MKHQVPWREVVPWVALLVVFSCAGAKPSVVAPGAMDHQRVRSLETDEIVLTGKDGKPVGKLSADGLTLADAKGNTVSITLGASAQIMMSGPGNAFRVAIEATDKGATIGIGGNENLAMFAVEPESAVMSVSAGKRTMHAAVESTRPLADLEVFDGNNKRRASFGLNSNGQPRMSIYDEAETRRIYGILDETGTAAIDVNNKNGDMVLRMGVDAAGKPIK